MKWSCHYFNINYYFIIASSARFHNNYDNHYCKTGESVTHYY